MLSKIQFSHSNFQVLLEGNSTEMFSSFEGKQETIFEQTKQQETKQQETKISSKVGRGKNFRFEYRKGGVIDINWSALTLIKKDEESKKTQQKNTHKTKKKFFRPVNYEHQEIDQLIVFYDEQDSIVCVVVEMQVLDVVQQRLTHFWVQEGYFVRSLQLLYRHTDNSKRKHKKDINNIYTSLQLVLEDSKIDETDRPSVISFLCQSIHIFSTYFENNDTYVENIRGKKQKSNELNYKNIPPLTEFPTLSGGRIIDSGLFGRYRFELHSRSEKSNASVVDSETHFQYVHLLYLFAPRQNKPSIVVLAQKLMQQKHYVLMLHTSEGVMNIGVDRQLRYPTYFRKKALEILHDYLQIPVLLEHPSNHPSLLDSKMTEFGYIGTFRFEVHDSCVIDLEGLPSYTRKSSLQKDNISNASDVSIHQDYSQMEYIFVCYLYEGHSVEPLLSFAFEKLHPSHLPSLQMRDEKQVFEMGFDPNLYDVGVFRDRCITLAHIYLHNFVKETPSFSIPHDNRYVWTQFFTNNLQWSPMVPTASDGLGLVSEKNDIHDIFDPSRIQTINSSQDNGTAERMHKEIEKIILKRQDTQEKIEHYIQLDRLYFSSLFLLAIVAVSLCSSYVLALEQWPFIGSHIPFLKRVILGYCCIHIFRLYQSSIHFFFQYHIRFFHAQPLGIWKTQIYPILGMIISLCLPITMPFVVQGDISSLYPFLEGWFLLVLMGFFIKSYRLIRQSLPSVICGEVRWWGTPIERVQLLKELRLKHREQSNKDTNLNIVTENQT